ncbi:MAG: TIGR03032 family protein [Planctomycetes bacterium]|nr:TIGR03032 family protein [Planctomycetota bacterium]MCB9885665.1 TIGR03032 family protein [Planctomycetota bacterium]
MTSPDASEPGAAAFRYVHSPQFPALLEQLRLSLAVTTYQAGKLMIVRSAGNKLSMLLRSFERPMGLAVSEDLDRMVIGTRRMVWTLRSAPEIAPQLEPVGRHDGCFVPRLAHVTGDMHGHEIAVINREIWLVNTQFSCLCVLDDEGDWSFEPQWKPPFIDRLAGEDRCHLNGMAIEDDRVRYVTAMGETNEPHGWRPGKTTGGVIVDVATNEIVTRGLCMPHSPRVHQGQLYVLDSGHGHLCRVDRASGERTTVAALPGYARGLAFCDRFAFVGLSLIREKDIFGGMPIAAQYDETQRKCGVCVVDLSTGGLVAFLYFEAGTAEIFDIQLLPGMRWPTVVGFQDETLDGIMIAPPGAWLPGAQLPVRPARPAP